MFLTIVLIVFTNFITWGILSNLYHNALVSARNESESVVKRIKNAHERSLEEYVTGPKRDRELTEYYKTINENSDLKKREIELEDKLLEVMAELEEVSLLVPAGKLNLIKSYSVKTPTEPKKSVVKKEAKASSKKSVKASKKESADEESYSSKRSSSSGMGVIETAVISSVLDTTRSSYYDSGSSSYDNSSSSCYDSGSYDSGSCSSD